MSFDRTARRAYRRWRLPLDRWAVALMAVLLAVAALLILLGDHAVAKVQRFSWQERTVGAENVAFTLTFTRPMEPDSVAANLQITPYLPGRVSWAGRRMAYTLDAPIPYGETYEVKLPEARDRFATEVDSGQFEPFVSTFASRDRAMAYIGTQGEEAGRLMLVNFSRESDVQPLTPPDWQVLDFEPYPLGDRILYSAVKTDQQASPQSASLFAVATGLSPLPPEDLTVADTATTFAPGAVGEVTNVLEGNVYQNLAFDLAPNGQKIVVQRVNQSNPADFGPWVVETGEAPRRLETEPGGEFLIGPESESLLMLQGQGTAVIPLTDRDTDDTIEAEPLDFLPEFGRVFDITSDGAAAAMVNFNQNDPERRFVETLVMVTNQGEETALLDATGSIISAEFDPTNQILYVLASDLLPGEDYQEQPYLAAIALTETPEPLKLLSFPPQARVSVNVSPDGLAALLGVAVTPNGNPANEQTQTILVPLFQTTEQRLAGTPAVAAPNLLPFTGQQPTWLP